MGSNKRMSDPFNEIVRARILSMAISSSSTSSSSSSGSEHDAEFDVVSSASASPCLSHLVQNFFEDDSNNPGPVSTARDDSDSDSDTGEMTRSDPTMLIKTVINPTVWNNADPFRKQLLAQVTKAVEIFSIFRKNKQVFHRNLMAYLREIGYNAGVCKTKWNSSAGGSLTAGNYEFLDVVSPGTTNAVRYIVDVEFSCEFELARETDNFRQLRHSLPKIFVGKPEDLKKILRLMGDEARRSMKMNSLTLPPWRKNRYMQTRWLGAYRRSTSHTAAPTVGSSAVNGGFPVKCRAVGFDIAGDSGRFFVPPVARTR